MLVVLVMCVVLSALHDLPHVLSLPLGGSDLASVCICCMTASICIHLPLYCKIRLSHVAMLSAGQWYNCVSSKSAVSDSLCDRAAGEVTAACMC